MELFRPKYRPMEKTAGTKISQNPQQWPAEVQKALASQHPYIDDQEVDLKMNYLDPEEKRAFGAVIVHGKVAVLFSIRPGEQTGRVELDPLDVMFVPNEDGSDGQFRHINEDSFREATRQDEVGDVYPESDDPYSKLPPGNEYIGDMTGDVTPLEWSGYPNSFGGSGAMRTAGCGLLSKVLKKDQDIDQLIRLLDTHNGVNRAATALGLRDSLAALEPEGDKQENPFDTSGAVQIRRDKSNHMFVDFDKGGTQPISSVELKEILQERFQGVMRKVMKDGWAIIRDFPTVRSAEVPAFSVMPTEVEKGGWYRVVTKGGDMEPALVCTQMCDFDGQTIRSQKIISPEGKYDEGRVYTGVSTQERQYPIGEVRSGAKGCFLDESSGYVATPNIKIKRTTTMPDEGTVVIATRMDTMEDIGLVMVDNLLRPQRVMPDDYPRGVVPENAYYFPRCFQFLETKGSLKGLDASETENLKKVQDKRPVATLRKNAGWYHLAGDIQGGSVNEPRMLEPQMRMKLASLGVDDYVIKKAAKMDEGQLELRGLRPSRFRAPKTASLSIREAAKQSLVTRRALNEFEKSAAEAMAGYDEAMQAENPDPLEDPQTLDAILSLQFISDETLEEISDSDNLLEMTEDKLAKMLMAARQGEKSIHEKGVQRALQGVGEARKSLKTLQIELDHREQS